MFKENKKMILNYKCNNCKRRYNLDKLDEEGYIECYKEVKSVECPNCGSIDKVK